MIVTYLSTLWTCERIVHTIQYNTLESVVVDLDKMMNFVFLKIKIIRRGMKLLYLKLSSNPGEMRIPFAFHNAFHNE